MYDNLKVSYLDVSPYIFSAADSIAPRFICGLEEMRPWGRAAFSLSRDSMSACVKLCFTVGRKGVDALVVRNCHDLLAEFLGQ